MIEAHLRKLRSRMPISSAEEAALREALAGTERCRPGLTIARAGEPLRQCRLVIDGWVARSKDVPGCSRRIAALNIPGDFADLHAFTLGSLDHDLVALTDCTFALFRHARLRELFARHPMLVRAYWMSADIEAARQRAWTISLGCPSTLRRVAHLMCEMYLRLELVGRTYGSSCEFRLTQNQIGQCVGATSVHVNRVLQELRSADLIRIERRELTILDFAALRRAARFDPRYLFAEPGSCASAASQADHEGPSPETGRPSA